MTSLEMREKAYDLMFEARKQNVKDITAIIDKLFNHPIAMADKHYEFLKEIEKDLREFRKNL